MVLVLVLVLVLDLDLVLDLEDLDLDLSLDLDLDLFFALADRDFEDFEDGDGFPRLVLCGVFRVLECFFRSGVRAFGVFALVTGLPTDGDLGSEPKKMTVSVGTSFKIAHRVTKMNRNSGSPTIVSLKNLEESGGHSTSAPVFPPVDSTSATKYSMAPHKYSAPGLDKCMGMPPAARALSTNLVSRDRSMWCRLC